LLVNKLRYRSILRFNQPCYRRGQLLFIPALYANLMFKALLQNLNHRLEGGV